MVDNARQMLEVSKGLRWLLGAGGVSCGVGWECWRFWELSERFICLRGKLWVTRGF